MARKLFFGVVVLALVVFFCAPAVMADEIKIGIMVPITGSEATYGKDMENAITMAVEEINAKGGVLGKKIVTTTGDPACDPQQGTSAATKLVSEDVVGVVGGYCSGATLPTLKIYGDANVPFVICAANSTKLIGANPGNAFMINSTGYDQVTTAVGPVQGKRRQEAGHHPSGRRLLRGPGQTDQGKMGRDGQRSGGL